VDFEKNVKAVSTFTLKVQSNKSDDLILSITGSYEILLITDGDIPKSFWNVYKSITLPLKIWPYFRELVQNITSRMNIPPLTLPILYK
jgi:preprotein translocase subunit SecB